MRRNPRGDLITADEPTSLATSIQDRLSQELVIALVGPVASGVSTTASFVQEILSQTFKYKVCQIIKPSKIIQDEAWRVGIGRISKSPLDTYILEMQTAGNTLREKYGGNYLIEKAIEQICKFRKENGGYSDKGVPLPGRRAYIIDSLKNPEELNLLRDIYQETLCVIGVFAPDSMRANRLKDNGVPQGIVKSIMDRDRGEVQTFGQKTRKLFVEADLFLCNDRKKEELRQKIQRFMNIIFDTTIHTPTRAEWAMYEANVASANSACMSRQVGAALVSDSGELISVGWNDVPRFGGGLYCEDHQSVFDQSKCAIVDKDNRCFKWGGSICHNEKRRKAIVDKIANKISESTLVKKKTKKSDILQLIKGTEIDSLIEFSRSIHAEMEAILAVAREGRHSLANSILYTRTYPCHNCARHIVAAGITSVVYIEPYDKSLAIDLHNDSISEDPDETTKVVFKQYDGVAPRHYLRLFRSSTERKQEGKVREREPETAVPIFRVPLDSPADYEAKVIADLSQKEDTSNVIQ